MQLELILCFKQTYKRSIYFQIARRYIGSLWQQFFCGLRQERNSQEHKEWVMGVFAAAKGKQVITSGRLAIAPKGWFTCPRRSSRISAASGRSRQ